MISGDIETKHFQTRYFMQIWLYGAHNAKTFIKVKVQSILFGKLVDINHFPISVAVCDFIG